MKGKRDDKHRAAGECLVKRDTHEPLVDRETFGLAQEKLASERERTSFAPRNPAYFLKQLFVCGHCGKGLTGRTETNPDTGGKTVMYVCPTYIAGRCNGHASPCGYHRISHADAERLLLDKIAEMGLPFEQVNGSAGRDNLQTRLARLGHDDEQSAQQWQTWINEGIDAFAGYLVEIYGVDYPVLPRLRRRALNFYCGEEPGDGSWVAEGLANLREAILSAEALGVEQAGEKLADLTQQHKSLTLAWVKATELQQGVLKEEIDRLEVELREWKPRTVPLSKRLEALYAAEAEREAERQKLMAEWPTLQDREKGEALRRLFKTVTLFWERTFHPASEKPTRPRKTERPGRFSYSLLRDRIEWSFPTTDLDDSW